MVGGQGTIQGWQLLAICLLIFHFCHLHAHEPVYLLTDTIAGLTNQKMCVLNGLAAAHKNGYAWIPPKLKIHSGSQFDWREVPALYDLGFFFSHDHLMSFSHSLGFTVKESLPPHLEASCYQQINGLNWTAVVVEKTVECPNILAKGSLARAALEGQGVVCLPAQCTFNMGVTEEDVDIVRPALQPSQFFAELVDAMLANLTAVTGNSNYTVSSGYVSSSYVSSSYVSVHVRNEADFKACDSNNGYKCFVEEDEITEFLLARLSPGSVLFIASGTHIHELRQLCSLFVCFNKHTLSPHHTSPHLEVNAFIDWMLAVRGSAFFGNRFSTFSWDVARSFNSSSRVEFYNPKLE